MKDRGFQGGMCQSMTALQHPQDDFIRAKRRKRERTEAAERARVRRIPLAVGTQRREVKVFKVADITIYKYELICG